MTYKVWHIPPSGLRVLVATCHSYHEAVSIKALAAWTLGLGGGVRVIEIVRSDKDTEASSG